MEIKQFDKLTCLSKGFKQDEQNTICLLNGLHMTTQKLIWSWNYTTGGWLIANILQIFMSLQTLFFNDNEISWANLRALKVNILSKEWPNRWIGLFPLSTTHLIDKMDMAPSQIYIALKHLLKRIIIGATSTLVVKLGIDPIESVNFRL